MLAVASQAAITSNSLDNIVKYCKQEKTNKKFMALDKQPAYDAALRMNDMIRMAMYETGVWNDKKLTRSDMYDVRDYVRNNYAEEFAQDLAEYKKIAYAGMNVPLINGSSAAITYYLNYDVLVKEKYTGNMQGPRYFFNMTTYKEMKAGAFYNPEKEFKFESSGTSLDRMIPFILKEEGINRRLTKADIREAAEGAVVMNRLLVKAIRNTGVADNRNISAKEIGVLNRYIVANDGQEWRAAHGLNGNIETGYHKIQNKGATTEIRGMNGIDTVGDSVYHLGYKTRFSANLVNENNQRNATFQAVSFWLNVSLQKEYKKGVLHSNYLDR